MAIVLIDNLEVKVCLGRAKNLRLTVTTDGTVRISAPNRTTSKQITAFVVLHKDWIARQQERRKASGTALVAADGQTVLLWGQAYTLRVVTSKRYFATENTEDRTLSVGVADASTDAVAAAIYRFYKQQTAQELQTVVPFLSAQTALYPTAFVVRKMRARWGSCNTKSGRLTFSATLAARPKECLRYVVLHELAHLKHPDHGEKFYGLLSQICPDHKRLRALLNGKTVG